VARVEREDARYRHHRSSSLRLEGARAVVGRILQTIWLAPWGCSGANPVQAKMMVSSEMWSTHCHRSDSDLVERNGSVIWRSSASH
jgi:hypothetical protein